MSDTGNRQWYRPTEMRSRTAELFVPGQPRPKGSPRPIRNRHTNKTTMVIDSDAARDWGARIASEASRFAQDGTLWPRGTPVRVELEFRFLRKAGHFWPVSRKRPNPEIRADAPLYHTVYPDTDKLLRVVLDALTHAGWWHDDSQAHVGRVDKVFADRCGVQILAYTMPGPHTVGEVADASREDVFG